VGVEQVLQHNTRMSEENIDERYLTYLQYFATGEGHTVELCLWFAANAKDAIQKHIEASFPNSLTAQAYFGPYIQAYPLRSDDAEALINEYFKHSLHIYQALVSGSGGGDFSLKLHYNFS
jgi:hypothetical protein